MTYFRLRVKINYDNSFSLKFGADAINVARRVACQASNMYQLPSLVQPLFWEVELGRQIPLTINASNENL